MIKAVIFDMDGVIIDSESIQSKAFEEVLKEYDKRPIHNKYGIVQTVGIRAKENWERLKELYHIDEKIEILITKRRKIYQKLIQSECKPMPGLLPALDFLKRHKLKLAIASSSNKKNINIVLSKLDIVHYFSVVVSGEEIVNGKPNPDIFLETVKRLHAEPKECIVIEDAESGILAAKAAGMKVIAVPNKYTKHHDFSKSDIVVDSLDRLNSKFVSKILS